MDKTNRIIYNTGIVYVQLIISTIISLLSVRYVLQALGEEDYGVYMLVAGVVHMLNVLSGSMSNTSMRYMSHSLGKKDLDISLKTFNTTLYIHYILAILVAIILEVGGWIMFEWILNIPEDKIFAAKLVYQFMIVTTIVTIVSVPFDAVINSHENLLFLSIINVLDSIFVIGIAVFLLYYNGNRLIMYGFLLMVVQIIFRIVKQIYTRRNYLECRVNFRKYRDKELRKSILSFTGWELVRSLATVCSTQMRGILINMFFGVKLNAAEGIGKKVNSHLNVVSTGITRAITPQMNKSEGGGNRSQLIHLTYTGVKYTTFMYCLLAIPLMIEIQYILDLWLKDVPEYTALFCQMCILLLMIDKFTWQIGNAIRAVGRIKEIQLFGSVIAFLTVVVSYFVFKAGAGPLSVYLVSLSFCPLTIAIRFYYGKKIVGLEPASFVKNTTWPVVFPIITGLVCALPVHLLMSEGFLRFCLVFLVFTLIDFIVYWFFCVTKSEQKKIKDIVFNMIHRVKHGKN